MTRHRRDLDDDDLLDRNEIEDRQADRAARLARAEHQALDRAAEDASLAKRSAKFCEESNRRAIVEEYRAHGVEPLKVDASGTPTCSLSLLLWMGWTVQDVGVERKLVAPPPYVHKPLPPKECT